MQEAGLVNFMRTILIIVVVYYALKFIGRIVFPIFFKRMMNNVEKKFNQQQHKNPTREQQVKEGETVIDKAPNQRTKSNNEVGDYVDYEDVE
jgi:bacteriorhodopsin